MLTPQETKAIQILHECGNDEYEIYESFQDEGVNIFPGEIILALADRRTQ